MQLREVIKEFGELVGFQSLETNNNGVVHITINKIGDLFIDEKYSDESGGNVFVYLLRVYERIDGELYKTALEMCDSQRDTEFIVNPVLHKEQALGFVIKYPIDQFDINVLQKMIRHLQGLQNRLEGGVSL